MERRMIKTDVLIIGGGTAGCFAAVLLSEKMPSLSITLVEKANIIRSGCLAAGVNALNAHINRGRTIEDYVNYVTNDASGIVRQELLYSIAEHLNQVTERLEKMGLVILKDEEGNYVERGRNSIKINGENIKPILAAAVRKCPQVQVFNHVNITKLLQDDEKTVRGAVGFSVNEETAYTFLSTVCLIATGGAAGLYRPNNPGFSRHKMWYSPFNTGAGYAMGIEAGAEMTTFEMRFIALRCKDTIAPTGTIAQGIKAKQINSLGKTYDAKYGRSTPERLHGTINETLSGRGPCYLHTTGCTPEQDEDLMKAYLNMAPGQTLRWLESERRPSVEDVEIEGTEPYVVGGHTASGYWIDKGRRTTLAGLYAAGDVAGGAPKKYVTGALAEAEMAAESIVSDFAMLADRQKEHGDAAFGSADRKRVPDDRQGTAVEEGQTIAERKLLEAGEKEIAGYEAHLKAPEYVFSAERLEEAMQKTMDNYAGGLSRDYRFNANQLAICDRLIKKQMEMVPHIRAHSMDELLRIYEVRERLVVCRTLIAHLNARKETRWHCYAENMDYPAVDNAWMKYVNSVARDGRIEIILRDLDYEFQEGDSSEVII